MKAKIAFYIILLTLSGVFSLVKVWKLFKGKGKTEDLGILAYASMSFLFLMSMGV